MIDWNWAGLRRPESRRNSSSVRTVLRERLAAAGSMPILITLICFVLFCFFLGGGVCGRGACESYS